MQLLLLSVISFVTIDLCLNEIKVKPARHVNLFALNLWY